MGAMFGMAMGDVAGKWTLGMSMGFASYICLVFYVYKAREEIRELQDQLRNKRETGS
jgi:hypothetical protein